MDNHALTPLAKDEEPRGDGVELPMLGRDEAITALVTMGLKRREWRETHQEICEWLAYPTSDFSLTRRGCPPAWATAPPSSLAALALVGEWDEDQKVTDKRLPKSLGNRMRKLNGTCPPSDWS